MNVSLTGRQLELTESIKDYVNASLASMEKYNLDIISASVVISKQERHRGISLEYTINIAGQNTVVIKHINRKTRGNNVWFFIVIRSGTT